MDQDLRAELVALCGKGVRFNCPLKDYTTLRVGGEAEAFCRVGDKATAGALRSFLSRKGIPCLPLGRGSNLLVRDGGLRGVALLLEGALAEVKMGDGGAVLSGAGAGIPRLLAFARQRGLGGLEFLAGIPGSVGGALAMNAGAWGMDVASRVRWVEVMDEWGRGTRIRRKELAFSYRRLRLSPGSLLLGAAFDVEESSPSRVSETMADFMGRRRRRQPIQEPNAGSIFKNPPGGYAGRLIEEAGLKGKRVGGAMISKEHANIIVNTGGARAADILALMEAARRAVRLKNGIELEPEIRIVGEDPGHRGSF